MERKDLITSPDYILTNLQVKLFNKIRDYLDENSMSQTEFAEKLGVSKGYVSQILNGEFDHKLSKFISLSLSVGKIPKVDFEDISTYISNDTRKAMKSIIRVSFAEAKHIDNCASHKPTDAKVIALTKPTYGTATI